MNIKIEKRVDRDGTELFYRTDTNKIFFSIEEATNYNKTQNTTTVRRCAECRNSEHENYDNDVKLVYVKDPDTKKIIKRAYLCKEHRTAFEFDGYLVNFC